jgi:hypothetical protein
LIRIDRDAFEQVHTVTMAARAAFAKLGGGALEKPGGRAVSAGQAHGPNHRRTGPCEGDPRLASGPRVLAA